MVSSITLANNKQNDITKVIRPLKDKGILLKGTAKKNEQSKGELLKFFAPLTRIALPLMKSVIISWKCFAARVTAAVSAADVANQKEIFRSERTRLIFSNEKLNDILKIVKFLEDSGLLIKGVSEKVIMK